MSTARSFTVLLALILIVGTAFAQTNYKRYYNKSGIITFKYEGSLTGTETLYFDNYGQKEARHKKTTSTCLPKR